MARSSNQKRKLAYLKEILLEYTDEAHPITMRQIITELAAKGIPAERKSIYDDIEVLKLLGVDVQTVRNKTTGYYVAKRDFESAELKLLVDAVRSSRFISEKQSNHLAEKLTSLACVHERSSLNRNLFVSNKAKSENGDIFNSVDRIHEAIESNKTISFCYFSWTVKKEMELRRSGARYFISPWALVWDDSNYYLVGYDNEKSQVRNFRVDKMLNVKMEDGERMGKEEFEKFDLASYSNASFGMFGGKMEKVTLRCTKRLANVMIDRFGRDTVLLNDGETFRIHVNVILGPVFLGWVLSFGGEVEILAPESAVGELSELVKSLKTQ